MKTNWTIITIENESYYTLKEVCKELGFKTQKAFIEAYENLVQVFKGIIAGKFVSIKDFNSLFLDSKEEEEVTTEEFLEEADIPMDVKKKFAKVLVSKYHPDNNGDRDMFLWANKLKKMWEKSGYVTLLTRLSKMDDEEFLTFMSTYEGQDKEELLATRGYSSQGDLVF